MKPIWKVLSLSLVSAAASISMLACGGSSGAVEPEEDSTATPEATQVVAQSTKLKVVLSEWSVKPDRASIPPGGLTMIAENEGLQLHDLVIVRADSAGQTLPVVEGRVDETKITIIGRFREFKSGEKEKQFALASGNYLLICNLVAHYESGMVAPLRVQ